MKTTKLIVSLILLSLFAIPLTGKAQVKEGEKAPDFVHKSLKGKRYQLSDLKGNVVYIFFFGASCPHCEANGPATEQAIYQNFNQDSNFVALGLDTWNESKSSVESFKETTGISYPLLLNAEQTLIDYYGNSFSYDRSVVVDQDGKVAYKGTEYVDEDTAAVKKTINELLGSSTAIENIHDRPSKVALLENYPNPFNPETNIKYVLNQSGPVNLSVYNPLGKKIVTLVKGIKTAGTHTSTFNAAGLPSGVYFYRLKTNGISKSRKMLLIK